MTLLFPVSLAKVSKKDFQVEFGLSFIQYPWQGFLERIYRLNLDSPLSNILDKVQERIVRVNLDSPLSSILGKGYKKRMSD